MAHNFLYLVLAQPLRPSSSMTFSTLSFRSACVIQEGRRRAAGKWRFSKIDSVSIITSSCHQYWRVRRNITDMGNGDFNLHCTSLYIHSQSLAKGLTDTVKSVYKWLHGHYTVFTLTRSNSVNLH